MLTNQGIPAIELLAKAWDMSTTQLTAAISKKLIPSAQAIPVLLAGITDKFGGMMEKQSQTFTGMLSNLSDAATKTLQLWGQRCSRFSRNLSKKALNFLIN